jgi:hypothetical protein
MNDFLDLLKDYQHFWLPLLVGIAVGVLAIATGNVVMRRRRRSRPPEPLKSQQVPGPPGYDPFVEGSPSDQRKAFRRQGNVKEVFYKLGDDKVARQGVVLDRSVGGLRLGLDEEIVIGARLLLLPGGASEMIPWTEVEVRTCRQIDDSWETGCQFIKVPPWSILLMFG